MDTSLICTDQDRPLTSPLALHFLMIPGSPRIECHSDVFCNMIIRQAHKQAKLPILTASRNYASTASSKPPPHRKKPIDETTLAGAQHKVSLSGPSLGHLISELSITRPGMENLRQEGMTMGEDQRRAIRNVVKAIVVVPTMIGVGIIGWNYAHRDGRVHE